jgi:hypothetical protein
MFICHSALVAAVRTPHPAFGGGAAAGWLALAQSFWKPLALTRADIEDVCVTRGQLHDGGGKARWQSGCMATS